MNAVWDSANYQLLTISLLLVMNRYFLADGLSHLGSTAAGAAAAA